MKNINFYYIFLIFSIFALGCPQAPNNSSNGSEKPLGADTAAYTWVVGVPYVASGSNTASLYQNLSTNLDKKVFDVNRVILSSEDPITNAAVYGIGADVGSSGLAVQELGLLAKRGKLEIYALADVEATSNWSQWTPPQTASNIPACQASISTNYTSDQQSMLKSVCWAALVNQIVGTPVLTGIAYDGQSLVMQDTDANRAWLYQQTSANKLKLGWVSSGLKSSVDLNLIEVYDLSKGSSPHVRIDTVAPESVYKVVTGISPVCAAGICSYTGDFPGVQFETQNNNTGCVGANIYQCAIANSDPSNACDSQYTTNIDTTQSPSNQMMQSLGYIFNQSVKTPLATNVYGAVPSPAPANNGVVYLFSTQYIGPVKSYAKSGQQCADAAGNCNCIASLYDPKASCGDENGFGSWGDHLSEFQNFVDQFMTSQGCNFPGGCYPGIYMYDFIPQKWLQ